jgi:cell division septation protein DedD
MQLRMVTGFAVVAVIAGLGGYVYQEAVSPTVGELPLIEADDSPTKHRPAEPGGMVIPNQDKLVYETLGDERNLDKIERLLPPPEEPLPPPEPVAPPPTPIVPAPAVPAAEPVAPPPEPAIVAPSAPVEDQPPIPAPKPVVQTPPAPAATAAPLAGFRIQLVALRSRADAEAAWRRLKRANADLLGALDAEVVRVDLGDQGVYYRLRAGPLANAAKAGALCARLKTRNLDCLVVKP